MYVKIKGWLKYSEEQPARYPSIPQEHINLPETFTRMLRFSPVPSPSLLVPKPHCALAGIRNGEVGLTEVTRTRWSSKTEQAVPWDTLFPSGSGVPVQLFSCKALKCKGPL